MADELMPDPAPENIAGERTVSHSFSHELRHEINWGYVALAVAALAAVYVLRGRLEESRDGNPEPRSALGAEE
jgi:hypothetical protein